MRGEQHVGRHVNCTLRPSSLTKIKTTVPFHVKLPTVSQTSRSAQPFLRCCMPTAPPLPSAATRPVPTGQRADRQEPGVEEKMASDVFK